MFETIKTETKGRSGWIIISREERRNALSPRMLQELISALKEFDQTKDLITVILTAAGEKSFCSGMDVGGGEALEMSFLDRHETQRDFVELLKVIKSLKKPVIGRIQGTALGGGFGLMCACDIVIAAENAQFGTPEINLGLFPYIIMAILIRTVNSPKALLEMMLTGERISADRARELGFVNYVVKRENLTQWLKRLRKKLTKKALLSSGLDGGRSTQ